MSTPSAALSHYRQPLGNNTNDLNERVVVASAETIKTRWPNTLRRKASSRALHPQADSSESLPSSHSSIFDALCCSDGIENIDSRTSWFDTFTAGGKMPQASTSAKVVDAEESINPSNPVPHSLHLPTTLETINEQRSIATLKLQQTSQARRKLSFSLDDLAVFRRPSRFFKNSSSSSTAAYPHSAPSYPTAPPTRPPPRTPTPPGLPSFNTPAASAYRLPPPNNRFRELLRRHKSPEMRQWRFQTARLPRGVLMRGEDGTLIRGRWRPSQSGHTGTARLGVPEAVPGQTMRNATAARGLGTSSYSRLVTGSDRIRRRKARHLEPQLPQDVGGLLNGSPGVAIGTPDGPGAEPLSRPSNTDESANRPADPGKQKAHVWSRIGGVFCLLCCGVERSDDGDLHPRIVPTLTENEAISRYTQAGL
ncbi:hypothetical protein MMC13_002896 [Lambiella insularis]|nr:hypothetical protein [Lambiella insularis]